MSEILDLDKAVNDMESQLDLVIAEVEKLAKMGNDLEKHQKEHRDQWKLQHAERLTGILKKASSLDNIIYQNF